HRTGNARPIRDAAGHQQTLIALQLVKDVLHGQDLRVREALDGRASHALLFRLVLLGVVNGRSDDHTDGGSRKLTQHQVALVHLTGQAYEHQATYSPAPAHDGDDRGGLLPENALRLHVTGDGPYLEQAGGQILRQPPLVEPGGVERGALETFDEAVAEKLPLPADNVNARILHRIPQHRGQLGEIN